MNKIEAPELHKRRMALNSLNNLLKQAIIVNGESPGGPFGDKRIQLRAGRAHVDAKAVAQTIR